MSEQWPTLTHYLGKYFCKEMHSQRGVPSPDMRPGLCKKPVMPDHREPHNELMCSELISCQHAVCSRGSRSVGTRLERCCTILDKICSWVSFGFTLVQWLTGKLHWRALSCSCCPAFNRRAAYRCMRVVSPKMLKLRQRYIRL